MKETTRRLFVRRALIAAGAGFALQGLRGQAQLTPDAALEALMSGNKRFVERRGTADQEDLAILRQHTAEKQQPFAAVLSCADSRVPVEIIFDQSIGHIFVTRIAGNVITPEIVASLEYGAAVLGTKAILVMGHANCGAVAATMEGKAVPGQISTLYQRIQPALDEAAGSGLDAATKANARLQSRLLQKSSTVIGGLMKENKLNVAAAYYELPTGRVTLLDKNSSG